MMELDLVLPAEDAARVLRSRLFTSSKTDRARSTPQRIVWHDTPAGELSARGLALAERRDLWRLERLLPAADGPERWLPASPPPVIAAAGTMAELDTALPEPLIACAAFEGRSTGLRLRWEGEELAVTLLAGQLRAVSGEHGCARLTIAGPNGAAVGFALAAAADLHLSVPRTALAAQALSIARGMPPAPRATGAPSLPGGASVGAGFRWTVGHLTDVILHWSPAAAAGADAEPVHQMRVAVRRLRAALSVFGPAADETERTVVKEGLRELNSMLGPTRDWDVFTAGTGQQIAAAFPDRKPVLRLLAAAERRRRACYGQLRAFLGSVAFRRLGIRLATFVASSSQVAEDSERYGVLIQPLADYASSVLDRKLKHMVRSVDDIESVPADELHAIRLRGKHLRYAAEFFAPLHCGRESRRFLRRLVDLQEHLGQLNDGAVAAGLMLQLPGRGADHAFAVGIVNGFAAGRREVAREELGRVWRKFRRQPVFWR